VSDSSSKFRALMDHRRYEQAEAVARDWIGQDVNDGSAHRALAEALREQGKHGLALQAIDRSIELDPDFDLGYALRTIELVSLRQYADALKSIDRAIELDPEDPYSHGQRAGVLHHLDRNKEALAAAEHGLSLDPNNSTCRAFRAMVLSEMGETGTVKDALREQLTDDPNDDMTHCLLGEALLMEGKSREAEVHFREALRLDPEFRRAREGLATAIHARSMIYAMALRSMTLLNRVNPSMAIGLLVLIMVLLVLGPRLLSSNPLLHWGANTLLLLLCLAFSMLSSQEAMFNLLLRVDKQNRHLLSPRQVQISNRQILPLVLMFLSLLSLPLMGRIAAVMGMICFSTAVGVVPHLFKPITRASRAKVWRWYAAGWVASVLAYVGSSPLGLFIGVLAGIWFDLSGRTVVNTSLVLPLVCMLIACYVCFEAVEKEAEKLRLKDQLQGHQETNDQ
jgi:tetratricopeptide (TPR) repeat protein